MRLLVLSLSVAPYVALVAADAWMHEKARRVPLIEQCLHLGIGLSVGSFLVLAFLGHVTPALTALGLTAVLMSADELGFHRGLSRRERLLHAAAAASLMLFVLPSGLNVILRMLSLSSLAT